MKLSFLQPITSIPEFIEHVDRWITEMESKILPTMRLNPCTVYRGEARQYSVPEWLADTQQRERESGNWVSSLKRDGHDHTSLAGTSIFQQEELSLRNFQKSVKNGEIKDIALQSFLSNKIDSDDINWFAAMQHFGIPTRLLDLTFDPLTALYFACCDEPDEDGLVVMMVGIGGVYNAVNIPFHYSNNFYDAFNSEMIFSDVSNKHIIESLDRAIVIWKPTIWSSERLVKQRGLFAWTCGTETTVSPNAPAQIQIKASAKQDILSRLEYYNITAITLVV